MRNLQTQIPSDRWVTASWEEYIQVIDSEEVDEKAKCYYHQGELRIEMSPVGHDHSCAHAIISLAVNLFGIIKGIPLKGLIICSYRQAGTAECQPDVSYYIGNNAQVVPWGTSIINLDVYPPPDLAIEVSLTSLADDRGQKRMLYEELGVAEYWIVDVEHVRILAFSMADRGSRQITESVVLPGLKMSVLSEALRRTRTQSQSEVGAWLMTQFQQ